MIGRLRWALRMRQVPAKGLPARLRLLFNDVVLHGLFNRGQQRCEDCGRAYPLWRTTDDEWEAVMEGPAGILCESCFSSRRVAL